MLELCELTILRECVHLLKNFCIEKFAKEFSPKYTHLSRDRCESRAHFGTHIVILSASKVIHFANACNDSRKVIILVK